MLDNPDYAQLVEGQLDRGLARKVCEYMIHVIEKGAWLSAEGVDLGTRAPSTLGEFREMLSDLDAQLRSMPSNEEAYRPLPGELEKGIRRAGLIYARRRILDYYTGSSIPEDVSKALNKHEFRLEFIEMQLKEKTPREMAELGTLLRSNDLFNSRFPSQFLARPPDFGLEE